MNLLGSHWSNAAEDPSISKDTKEMTRLSTRQTSSFSQEHLTSLMKIKTGENVKLISKSYVEGIRHLMDQPGRDISVGGSDLFRVFHYGGPDR